MMSSNRCRMSSSALASPAVRADVEECDERGRVVGREVTQERHEFAASKLPSAMLRPRRMPVPTPMGPSQSTKMPASSASRGSSHGVARPGSCSGGQAECFGSRPNWGRSSPLKGATACHSLVRCGAELVVSLTNTLREHLPESCPSRKSMLPSED